MVVRRSYTISERDDRVISILKGEGFFTTNSEVVRTALRHLASCDPTYRTTVAVELYCEGVVCLGEGADIAGMEKEEFREAVEEKGWSAEED